jgi:xanthine/uracil/vitamin C permease (AzgA family)
MCSKVYFIAFTCFSAMMLTWQQSLLSVFTSVEHFDLSTN